LFQSLRQKRTVSAGKYLQIIIVNSNTKCGVGQHADLTVECKLKIGLKKILNNINNSNLLFFINLLISEFGQPQSRFINLREKKMFYSPVK
jgi:hypothetical protein